MRITQAVLLLPIVFTISLFASSPAMFSYQGRLFDDGGDPVDSGSAAIVLQIFDPNGNCLLFEESHSVLMSDTAGYFRVSVGLGTKNTSDAPDFAFKDVFSNASIFNDSKLQCANYTPGANDHRLLRVHINGEKLVPDHTISAVPYSIESQNAAALGGKTYSNITNYADKNLAGSALPDLQASPLTNGDSFQWDGSKWIAKKFAPADFLSNSVTLDDVSFASSNGIAVPSLGAAPGSPTAGQIYFNSVSNKIFFYNGTTWVDTSASTGGDFKADGSVAMTGPLNLNGNYLSGDGGSEGIYVDTSGNVGIGTASPSSKIEVLSNLTSGSVAGFTGAKVTANTFSSANVSGFHLGGAISATVNGGTVLHNRALTLNSGTGAAGTISSSSTGLQNTVSVQGTQSSAIGASHSVSVAATSSLTSSATASTHNLSIQGGTTSTATGVQTGVSAISSGNINTGYGIHTSVSGNVSTGYGVFITDISGSTNQFGIYQSAASDKNYFGGNVGIGTTSPQSALEVDGYIQLDVNSAAPPGTDCDAAAEYGRMRVDADTGDNVLYICTADGWQSYSPGAGGSELDCSSGGMTLVPASGIYGAFCIDSSSATGSRGGAASSCASSGKILCGAYQMKRAGAVSAVNCSSTHWIRDMVFSKSSGSTLNGVPMKISGASCGTTASHDGNPGYSYRCCTN